jgi:hypothetical protein
MVIKFPPRIPKRKRPTAAEKALDVCFAVRANAIALAMRIEQNKRDGK